MGIGDILLSVWLAGGLLAISLLSFFIMWLVVKATSSMIDLFGLNYPYLSLEGLWAGLPLSIAGIVAGFITGISREPAVSALIPAALTLVGGTALYLIGKDRGQALVVGFGIVAFSFNLLVGTNLGSANRNYLESLEYLEQQAREEFLLRRYRKGLGLPPYPPGTPLPEE